MNRVIAALAAVLTLHPAAAAAQSGHSHAGHAPAPPVEAKPAAAREAPPASVPRADVKGYASPFADYRPFEPQEPSRSWRAANDDVREAGGHVGVQKSLEAAEAAPAARGSKP